MRNCPLLLIIKIYLAIATLKAFKHLLVMPRRLVSGFAELSRDDLPMLNYMRERGEAVVDQYLLATFFSTFFLFSFMFSVVGPPTQDS